MSSHPTSMKTIWQSRIARNVMWAVMVISFILVLLLGSWIREQEFSHRNHTVEQAARNLAETVIQTSDIEDDILLKVNDLLNLESVLGIRLQSKNDIPLNVGELDASFLDIAKEGETQFNWQSDNRLIDIAIKLETGTSFDWLIIRLEANKLVEPPLIGTLVNWIAAPLIALINGLSCLWIIARFQVSPLYDLQTYLRENNGKYALSQVPPTLCNRKDEYGLLAKQIEAMRKEVNDAKAKVDLEARFLHETPFPLIRCSVNRKVLYANVAARSEQALFGDETGEFVSAPLSELVRKAFYESKEIFGRVRCRNRTIIFRAIPVLDAGYVNLYGENDHSPDDQV